VEAETVDLIEDGSNIEVMEVEAGVVRGRKW
jgi:hypothetical protein